MNLAYRLKMARQKGEALLKELGVAALPIDPIAIAERHDILVEAKHDAEPGVSGVLLRHGNAFGILYSTYVPSEGFQRFSVSHELGHFFLDGHVDHVLPANGFHASMAGFVSADPYEMEADSFAAGLLMPSQLFRRALGRHEAGMQTVETLAATCRTSLPATAIRYAELTEDAIAVVVSTDGVVDYCCISNTMKSLPQIRWLKRGTPVPKGSATAHLSGNRESVRTGARSEAEIDITDWLGGTRSALACEEVLGLGRYGKTLTVLSCPSVVEETFSDDEKEDERLDESWTPRFRR